MKNNSFEYADQSLSALISDLRLRTKNDAAKSKLSRYGTTKPPYDIAIDIKTLAQLETKGWEIQLGERARNIPVVPEASENSTGVVVAVIGAFNRGKSFLLKHLCGVEFPSSHLIRTEGICITAGRNNYKNIVFLDTAGIDRPIKMGDVAIKKATEALLREIVLNSCSFIIIVVNRLRATDQIYIHQILEHCKNTNGQGLIIVHNLLDVETDDDLQTIIKEEIIGICGATLREMTFDKNVLKFFMSILKEKSGQTHREIRHFVLAKDGSKAAKAWNLQSIQAIMYILQTTSDYKRKLNIINEMINLINSRLPQLFQKPVNCENKESLRVTQHETQPYLVLESRKTLPDTNNHPCALELSQSIVCDDAGYLIRTDWGEWRPRYNVYEYDDKVHAIIELPGLKEFSCKTITYEHKIVIEGVRDHFIQSPENSIVFQSDIPTGPFSLTIHLRSSIEVSLKQWTWNSGLLQFSAPIKKPPEDHA